MLPPVLRTERLVLAAHAAADLEEMAAMWADPAVFPLVGGPVPREQVWHRLLRYAGHWQIAGYGHWGVRLVDGGTYLGEVGLMDSRRATDPGFEGVPEAGWAFATAAHGQGYAGEACAAMLAWADGQGIARTVCIIAPGNAPSIRLAERLGYRAAGTVRYREAETRLFERAANQGRAANSG